MTTELPLQYRKFWPFGSPLITRGIPLSVWGSVANTLSIGREEYNIKIMMTN